MRYTIQIKLMISFSLAASLLGVNGQVWYNLVQTIRQQDMAAEVFSSSVNSALGVTVASFACILGIGLWTSSVISRPAIRIAERMENMASGHILEEEISSQIRHRDELGDAAKAMNRMARNLRSLIRRVSVSSQQVTTRVETLNFTAEQSVKTTKEIGDSMDQVTLGAERQVDRVSITMKTLEEMNNGLRRIAEFFETVDTSAQNAVKEAVAGNAVIFKNRAQIKSIQSVFDDSAENVRSLSEHTQEIGNFVRVITTISETTHLLALNASIEAARAGEHGRGFSVVANEVKKLAVDSKRAADHISSVVKSIQNETLQAFHTMQQSSKEVSTGMELMSEASIAFKQISEAINEVTTHSGQIREITNDAFIRATQITSAVDELASIAKEAVRSSHLVASSSLDQTASMEEIFQATEELQKMGHELNDLVRMFKV
ncbi:HAMP domain-containing methyl-accepting chemotaxis protein [Paenibacillus qinlingensis]|uniref:Methyl-accepting chemotaxis protein n=1 Tax=Paenibacillus qinlingensis TaxID=1837343 RepID=A0ABU1NU58_9BACL|nr:HAMP domain-containing methyl-accepting chemotaxis protein [Paenibacillus qinlingensis]MDR6551022.1 methyl-accepting chemotaxis protein [Paenibacillus qinlingensis]